MTSLSDEQTIPTTIATTTPVERLFRKPTYTVAEVASILLVSIGVVYGLINRSELAASKIGASLRINRRELERYVTAIGLEVEPGQ